MREISREDIHRKEGFLGRGEREISREDRAEGFLGRGRIPDGGKEVGQKRVIWK